MKIRDVERKVLCGLMKYPEDTLTEVSSKMNMKYWTIYKIVKKLKERHMLREITIPNFEVMNYELLVAGYGNITKKKMCTHDNMKKFRMPSDFSSGVFYGFVESYRGFVLGLSENFTEIKKNLIYAERMIELRNIMDEEKMSLVMLPLKLARIPIFFDYSMLLCRDVNEDVYSPKGLPALRKKMHLSEREKKAISEITLNPELSLSQLAKTLNVSVQTASKIRKKLYDEHILIRRYIPNLRAMGYDVLVFAHWIANPNVMERLENMKINEVKIDVSPIIFLAYDKLEGIAMAPFKNLRESRDIISFFEKFGENTGVLVKAPRILFLSIQEGMEIKDHLYHPLVERAFNV